MSNFRNKSGKEFVSVHSEKYRVYVFKDSEVRIDEPLFLNVGPNGHRIFDKNGISHYIPSGWVQLYWEAKEDYPHYEF